MKYIIMCGGRYNEWTVPRQMTPINDEPNVARTIRLLRENDVTDIAISTNNEVFEQFGVPLLHHKNTFDRKSGAWVEAFYPTDEPACYLFGDVVYSPEAIRTIVNTETDGIEFFASAPPFSPEYIKKWAEPFAFKVVDQKRFRAAIDFVKANVGSGIFRRHPIAWELWQILNGWNVNDIDYDSYIVINDYTCDLDTIDDAKRISEVVWQGS